MYIYIQKFFSRETNSIKITPEKQFFCLDVSLNLFELEVKRGCTLELTSNVKIFT